ncbi:MAG: hypothetical protein ABH986_00140 [archaeon]
MKNYSKAMVLFFLLMAAGTASAAITVGVSTDAGTYNVGDKITVTATVYDGSSALNKVTVTTAIRFVTTSVRYWNGFGNTGTDGAVTWNDAQVGETWYNGKYKVTARISINGKVYTTSADFEVNNPDYIYAPKPRPRPKLPLSVCP